MAIPAPQTIRLEASSLCQLRCPSCPTTTGAIHPAIGSGFLRIENFKKLVARNPALRRVELSNYGEIFLNPHLTEILEHAAIHGIAITIDNGANLNHARDDVLEALVKYGVHRLTCSIDGASAATYARYRVRGDFDRVIGHIKKINTYKAAHGSILPQLTWQFVVFGHNEHEIQTAREMAAALDMTFKTKLSWDSDISPIQDRARVQAETGGTAATREEYETIHGKKYLSAICFQLWDDIQINWDGKTLGCCRNFWGDFGANAFEQNLTTCLASEKMTYARAMLRGQAPAREDIPCTTCDMYLAMAQRAQWIDRPEPADAPAPSPAARVGRRWPGLRQLLALVVGNGRK